MSHDGTNGSQAETDPQMLHRVFHRPIPEKERRDIEDAAFARGRVYGEERVRAEALPRIAAAIEGYAGPAFWLSFLQTMAVIALVLIMGWFAMRAHSHDRAARPSIPAAAVQER